MPQALLGLELAELEGVLGPGQPRYRSRQLYQAIYQQSAPDLASISTLPRALRTRLEEEQHTLGLPEVERHYDSADGTRRYLLRLPQDQRTVETVLMPEESRDTICISTQVGCAVGCRFCLTARMGLERNLSAGEIVGQVLLVERAHGLRRPDASPQESAQRQINIVMMGMGEPLLNLANVLKATRILVDPEGVGLSPRRITLSTAGIIPAIEELGRAEPRPKLAVSLNASNDQQRRELMPVTRKYPLGELLEACRAYPLRTWERLTFEYALLGGVNDSDADARRVVKLLAHLKAKVNLIPLNPGPGIPFETPAPDRVRSFQAILRRALPCFIRQPRGRDIYAACGQLRRIGDGPGDAPIGPQA